jgi:hypothetical protein
LRRCFFASGRRPPLAGKVDARAALSSIRACSPPEQVSWRRRCAERLQYFRGVPSVVLGSIHPKGCGALGAARPSTWLTQPHAGVLATLGATPSNCLGRSMCSGSEATNEQSLRRPGPRLRQIATYLTLLLLAAMTACTSGPSSVTGNSTSGAGLLQPIFEIVSENETYS